jgi:hypothetical protein
MKIKYESFKFGAKRLDMIDKANDIIIEYQNAGYDLTIRQLYYQFVARGFIENNLRSYTLLSKVINNARLAGLIDWDAIIDRTRNLQGNSHWDDPGSILQSCADCFRIDTRLTQPLHMEVWVEKDALTGVVEPVCIDADVKFLACRGYVSQSAMWRATMRFKSYENVGKEVIIWHLGDHDPSEIFKVD